MPTPWTRYIEQVDSPSGQRWVVEAYPFSPLIFGQHGIADLGDWAAWLRGPARWFVTVRPVGGLRLAKVRHRRASEDEAAALFQALRDEVQAGTCP